MIKMKDGMWQFFNRYLSGNARTEAVWDKAGACGVYDSGFKPGLKHEAQHP